MTDKLFFKLYQEIPAKYIFCLGHPKCLITLEKAVEDVSKIYCNDDIGQHIKEVKKKTNKELDRLYHKDSDYDPSEDCLWPE